MSSIVNSTPSMNPSNHSHTYNPQALYPNGIWTRPVTLPGGSMEDIFIPLPNSGFINGVSRAQLERNKPFPSWDQASTKEMAWVKVGVKALEHGVASHVEKLEERLARLEKLVKHLLVNHMIQGCATPNVQACLDGVEFCFVASPSSSSSGSYFSPIVEGDESSLPSGESRQGEGFTIPIVEESLSSSLARALDEDIAWAHREAQGWAEVPPLIEGSTQEDGSSGEGDVSEGGFDTDSSGENFQSWSLARSGFV